MRFLFALASLASATLATSIPTVPDFKCSVNQMDYCHWTKSCACPPGKSYDLALKACVGVEITGPWPKPDCKATKTKGVDLAEFCAISPTQIVPYNAKHKWCQAGLDTITFCADASITAELDIFVKAEVEVEVNGIIEIEVEADVEIDLHAKISAQLKNVCAALSGLYLKVAADAVILFNTNAHGLVTVAADVEANVSVGLLAQLKVFLGLDLLLGGGKKAINCVDTCVKGCKNYIDVDAQIGATLPALSASLVILPDVLIFVKVTTHEIVSLTIEGLLCIVGRVLTAVLSIFDCGCK